MDMEPLGNNIIVQIDTVETKTAGGLYIPEIAQTQELNIYYDGTEENGKAGWYSLPYEFLEWGVNKLTQEQKDRIMEID